MPNDIPRIYLCNLLCINLTMTTTRDNVAETNKSHHVETVLYEGYLYIHLQSPKLDELFMALTLKAERNNVLN